MELTGRQQVFLERFLAQYKHAKEALHYGAVAKHLGIGNVTAYEMLRFLEKQGLVASEYVLPMEGKRGPGRSRIVFYPTRKATDVAAELEGREWNDREGWEDVKKEILHELCQGRGTRYDGLLEKILLHVPECENPMRYLAEVITAVILSLYQLSGEAGKHSLFAKLQNLGVAGEMGLQAIGGLIVGLSFVERADRQLTSKLLGYLQEYQALFGQLSAADEDHLSGFTQEVIEALQP